MLLSKTCLAKNSTTIKRHSNVGFVQSYRFMLKFGEDIPTNITKEQRSCRTRTTVMQSNDKVINKYYKFKYISSK